MPEIYKPHDFEIQRQQRNITQHQKRSRYELREGVLVDNLIKPQNNLSSVYDELLIGEAKIPPLSTKNNVTQYKKNSFFTNQALLPLCLLTTGIFAGLAGISGLLLKAAKNKIKLPSWQTLPEISRNIALNDENNFAIYTALQKPNFQTFMSACGIFTFGAATVIAKNFIEGSKDIWIKKQEADIQRNLQEELINVETKTFSGKIQIIRNMLANKAKEFETALQVNDLEINPKKHKSKNFQRFLNFKSNNTKNDSTSNKNSKSNNLIFTLLTGTTTIAILGFTYLALKNLQKTGKFFEEYKKTMQNKIQELLQTSTLEEATDITTLKKIIIVLQPNKNDLDNILSPLENKIEEKKLNTLKNEIIQEVEKISQAPPEAFAGTPNPKPSFYSYIDDARSHLYNWLMNFDSPLLGALFCGITGIGAISFVGNKAVEALKTVQVSKVNAQTELNLQKRLVDVELKNFETKKNAAISPLIEEFYRQLYNKKDKKELKNMAENILREIKNGPPYVYS